MTGILHIASSARLRLSQQVALGKAECRCGLQMRFGECRLQVATRTTANFLSSRRTSAVVCDATHDTRTHYAVDVTGGGRSSAISRRMSAKRFLGIATSAIWKTT